MTGLTFKEILAKTPGNRQELAQLVKLTYLKFGRSKKLGVLKAICQSHTPGARAAGKKYATMIEFYADNKVKVSCSCEDHLYRWEYALARKKASYITYSNGERPKDTNPKMVAGCCKHCIALYATLRAKKLLPKKSELPDVTV